MAQAVGRKTMLPRDTVSRPVAVKAFGDTTAKQTKTRNKSSSKIPKTLRHDLENALVNLCDIWFEEIKPHLIRNNIKLHVHGQAGDGKLPPAAPGCSHLDPGAASDNHQQRNASCADCCRPPRTASAARCRRPPPRPAPPRPNTSPVSQNQIHHRNECSKRKPRKRKRVRKHTQSEGRLRVPRLCHNLGLPPPTQQKSSRAKRQSKYNPEIINSIQIRRKTKEQSTQTEINGKLFNSISCNVPKSPEFTENKRNVSFRPNQPRRNRLKKDIVHSPLFEKDLIDIICSENDKRLKILYKSPSRSNKSSLMNLMPELETQSKKCKKKGNTPPWK
ncbi:unnamed protein product [Colias eurytheme]|nr:unnamed protein product [Colias eurytheme]